ncbi:MAG: hypothetical protein V4592_13970 [Bacteroidota bacterium]
MKFLSVVLFFVLGCNLAMAQAWSIPSGSAEKEFGTIVYIESVYPRPGAAKGINDTLTSTGILLKDSSRIYLVTTKHGVQRELLSTNQQLLNSNISFTTAAANSNKVKNIKLPELIGKEAGIEPYILSSDVEDIAIISFQKNGYKALIAALKKDEGRPLPVDSLDMSDDHYPDENYFHPSYMVYKSKTGARTWSKGLGTAKIKTYPDASPTFTITDYIGAGNNGSPLFINDKIIGMVRNGEGMGPNAVTIKDPFQKSKTGIVIKATRILPLLRKLQEVENMPGF